MKRSAKKQGQGIKDINNPFRNNPDIVNNQPAMSEMLFDVAKAIEQTASQTGLLMMKALIDEEVEQLAGIRYQHVPDRKAVCWGNDEASSSMGHDKLRRG